MSKLDLSELLHKIVNVATRIFLSCCMAFQPSECGNTHIQYQNDQFDQFLQMTFILSVHPPCVGHLKKLFRTIKIRTGFTGEGQGRSKSPPKNGLNLASGSYSGH